MYVGMTCWMAQFFLFCDWKKLVMNLGSRYKDMVIFRLAMRQYAIENEFELGIEATDQTR
jgi:hypothetical protein